MSIIFFLHRGPYKHKKHIDLGFLAPSELKKEFAGFTKGPNDLEKQIKTGFEVF